MNGVINYPDNSRHADYLFRVALKAVVVNEQGEVLIVKETDHNWWDIPGGGLDHGETIKEGLARELHEEVGYVGDFEYEIIDASEPHVIEHLDITQIRFTFLVRPANLNFQPGDDGDEIKFIDPDEFKDSEDFAEQSIYRLSKKALERL